MTEVPFSLLGIVAVLLFYVARFVTVSQRLGREEREASAASNESPLTPPAKFPHASEPPRHDSATVTSDLSTAALVSCASCGTASDRRYCDDCAASLHVSPSENPGPADELRALQGIRPLTMIDASPDDKIAAIRSQIEPIASLAKKSVSVTGWNAFIQDYQDRKLTSEREPDVIQRAVAMLLLAFIAVIAIPAILILLIRLFVA